MESVRIPQERIAVLIGQKGEAKRRLERKAGVRLSVDEEGLVEISAADPYNEFVAKDVVKAIGRGFSPDDSLKLAEGDYYLKVIDLKDVLGSDKAVARQKARVIGEEGKTKRMIESCACVKMSVYGSTVSLIGLLDEVGLAAEAISRLLEGKPHSFVYRLLEHGRKRMKEERIAHMWEPAAGEGECRGE
ncbi:MAG: KH domain-containing protein [Candidatus ainarchaeum sp.]|nr:KH domain-containing protein [Candidatus ainarchaeum sp.]